MAAFTMPGEPPKPKKSMAQKDTFSRVSPSIKTRTLPRPASKYSFITNRVGEGPLMAFTGTAKGGGGGYKKVQGVENYSQNWNARSAWMISLVGDKRTKRFGLPVLDQFFLLLFCQLANTACAIAPAVHTKEKIAVSWDNDESKEIITNNLPYLPFRWII